MTTRINDVTSGTPNNTDSFVRIPNALSTVGSPWTLVTGRFDSTATYASNAFDMTTTFAENISGLLNSLVVPSTTLTGVSSPGSTGLSVTERPDMSSLTDLNSNWQANAANRPRYEAFPIIRPIDIPGMNFDAPSYDTIAAPETEDIQDPGDGPSLGNVVIPAEPDYEVPEPPSISDVFLPPTPVIAIPAFDASFTDEALPTPAEFNWNESPYNSEIWQTLLDKTLDGIINGGTGLSAEVEQMIFDRAAERARVTNEKLFSDTEDYFASRGFDLPPGAMASRMAEASAEIARNEIDVSEKIAIEQANLAQKNTHFMLELGRQSEVVLRDFHNNQEARALDAAKSIASHSIEIVNGYIARYNARIDKYKADTIVYGEQIKGVLIELDVYKAQLEGVKIVSEVEKTKVDIYVAQVGAVETLSKFYATRLEGSKIQADLERLKIETFKAEIDIYTAKITAEKIKSEMYGIEVEAERTKAMIYAERVKGYLAEVEAKKAELEAQTLTVESVARKNTVLLEEYKADLGAYGMEIDTQAKKIDATVTAYEADVRAYEADTAAKGMFYDGKKLELDASIQTAKFELDRAIAEIEASTKGYIAVKELQLKGSDGVLSVSAQLAASALSAVSASASYGYNGSESLGHSFNYGADISESHSFAHPTDVS